MNRRELLKSVGLAMLAPITGLPVLPTVCPAITAFNGNGQAEKMWAGTLFKYALENMRFANFVGSSTGNIIVV